MLSEHIILQSVGSLSVAVLALFMVIVQALFFFRKPQFTWYAWSAAISFSALLYSVGIFLEYNTPPGPLNRFSGLLEWTAIICLIHCLYGFTFSYLGIETKRYHPVAGVCHGLILIFLWSTHYFVAENFTTRDFIGLESPYTEPALGPLGPVFELYVAIAGVNAMLMWLKHRGTDRKYRITYLAGMGIWVLLGIHDGLASLGVPTLQYVMEYGFLGFAMAVLWVVFNSYLEIAAEEKYRVITEFANDCILVIQDGKMVFGNPACCDLIGQPLTDSAPRDFLDIMASEDRKTVLEHYNTLLEGGHVANPQTVRIRREDGEQKVVETTSSLIRYRNRTAFLAIMRDITERKRVEEALRESEEKYRDLVENINDVIYAVNDKGMLTYISPAIESFTGHSPSEIIGQPFTEFVHEEDLSDMKKRFEEVLSGNPQLGEYRVFNKSGEIRWILASGKPSLMKNGVIGVRGVFTDITERKRGEQALRESEERFRILFEYAPVGYYLNDLKGNFVDGNRVAEEIFGYKREELIGKNFLRHKILPLSEIPKAAAALAKNVCGKPTGPDEFILNRKDGTQVTVEITTLPVKIEAQTVVLGVARDITKRKEMERTLTEREQELEIKTSNLEEANTALRVLLKRRDEDKRELEEKVLFNMKELAVPYLEKLKASGLDERQTAYLKILGSNLNEIISPFSYSLSSRYLNLTPAEIQVASLIKQGKTSKEIAEFLNLSTRTIGFHRANIREKTGIKNKKANLRAHLVSLH
jgi:PAS domain S-box-containing protein